jgi:hypothetical protein
MSYIFYLYHCPLTARLPPMLKPWFRPWLWHIVVIQHTPLNNSSVWIPCRQSHRLAGQRKTSFQRSLPCSLAIGCSCLATRLDVTPVAVKLYATSNRLDLMDGRLWRGSGGLYSAAGGARCAISTRQRLGCGGVWCGDQRAGHGNKGPRFGGPAREAQRGSGELDSDMAELDLVAKRLHLSMAELDFMAL